METPEPAAEVVAFWREAGPQRWFKKDAAFDQTFRERFEQRHYEAACRALDAWAQTGEGSLALLILLDQFPRNAFRGCAHMFATDPLARHFASQAIARGFDQPVEPDLRRFFYLPFMHSESMADQQRSLALHRALGDTRYAENHHEVILRFGRFPHRNRMLGRETTAEERAFLDAGGFAG